MASTRVALSQRLARQSAARLSTSRVSGHGAYTVYGLAQCCAFSAVLIVIAIANLINLGLFLLCEKNVSRMFVMLKKKFETI